MAKDEKKGKNGRKVEGAMLRKLTSKAIIGGPINVPEDDTHLYTIFGFASSHGTKVTNYGDSTMFMGDFHAVRAEDGKNFAAPIAYLPEPLSSMLKAQLDGRQRDSISGALDRVKFAAQVWIVPEPKNKVGYEYRVKPVAAPEASAEIADLRKLALTAG